MWELIRKLERQKAWLDFGDAIFTGLAVIAFVLIILR